MSGKIKLNSASGGGSVSIQAPSSSSNNRVISLPDIADGTLLTSESTLSSAKLTGALPAISGAALTGIETSTVAFFAAQSTTHNVPHSTYTKVINLDQDEVTQNAGSSWADSRFTVASGQEGVYFLFGASAIDDVQRNDTVNLRFYKNGSALFNYASGRLWYSGGSTPNQILLSGNLSGVTSLAVGDYVELFVYHNEGSTEPTEAGPTYFGGYKL